MFYKATERGVCLIFVQHRGKQSLTAEQERSSVRNACTADKADVCAPTDAQGDFAID